MPATASRKPPAKPVRFRPSSKRDLDSRLDAVQAFLRSVVPRGVSLSNELLADRRREAMRDAADA